MSNISKIVFTAVASSLVAAGFAAPAVLAQDAAQGQASSDAQQIEEVVVTAQRRSERLQDVPIAVEAFDAATMQAMSITDTSDLGALTPGLVVNRVASSAIFTLRGIGNQNAATLGDEGATILYVDGVYLPGSQGAVFDFNNVDRIEVLNGPQGTLFGRNATGGVVQVITKTPSQTPHVDFDVGYGNYNTATSNLYGTTGITQNLAADIAIHYADQSDGWGRNLYDGADEFTSRDFGMRSKWLLTLEDTSVTLAGDYNRSKDNVGTAYSLYPGYAGVNGHVGPAGGFYDVDLNFPSESTNTIYGESLTVDQDLTWAHLVSISAFHRIEANNYLDQDGTSLAAASAILLERERTYTEELQLRSAERSAIKWLTGVYYYNDQAGYYPVDINDVVFINSHEDGRSYAGFAQATAQVLPATDLTLGVRYTADQRHVVGDIAEPGIEVPGNQSKTFDKTTFRVALDHHFTDDVLGYVSFNRGFKSGVFNAISPSAPAVQPEVLDASEIGIKSEFFDRHLRFNSAFYYYKFSDLQLLKIVSGSAITVNAADATVKGVDANLEAVPMRNLTLRVGFAFIDSDFTSYPNAPINVPAPGGGLGSITGNATGNDLPYAPHYTANIGGDYAIPTELGNFTVNANYAYTDALYVNADNLVKLPPYGLVSASVKWTAPSGRYDVRLWGKNLGNDHYYSYVTEQQVGVTASPAEPRTFGVVFGTHW